MKFPATATPANTNPGNAISSFFDVNRFYGSGARGVGEFQNPGELLRHMDYLQIDRALVWNIRSKDLYPAWGNRSLIAETEPFRDRLVPALVVTPSMVFEDGVLDELRESISKGGVRALRIFPAGSGFPMASIQRLLSELADLRPSVFWNFRDRKTPSDAADFARMAKDLPGLSFVITELMWPQFTEALDLMWRAGNIHIDISWLHMRDTIELLCSKFGAQRVLFGTGFPSHYGAAQAMLVHSRISAEEKELIAHGNAERLTGLAAPRGPLYEPSTQRAEKPLWESFRRGQPLRGVKVIDAHTHIGPRTRGWTMRDQEPEVQIPALISQMDSCGVERMIVAPGEALFGDPVEGNRRAAKRLSPHQDRMSAYFCFNPHYCKELVPLLDEHLQTPLYAGLKVIPSYWMVNLNDPRYLPVWEAADRYRVPILIHTWNDAFNSPIRLESIAPKYPRATFLLAHAGGRLEGRQEAEALAATQPNVFLEFCGSFTDARDWAETIACVGAEKIVFGSDTDAHSLAWELGRFLSIPLPDAELEPMLGKNMERILSLKHGGLRQSC